MDMEVNGKKFRLLKSRPDLGYFETARLAYLRNLDQIIGLNSGKCQVSKLWMQIEQTYKKHSGPNARDNFLEMPLHGEQEDLAVKWMDAIETAQQSNVNRIEQALIRINAQSREIVRNGMIGFGISIVVGEKKEIMQVLMNIIGNAIKYTGLEKDQRGAKIITTGNHLVTR